ncbi:ATP-binding protein [Paenibacillus sp. PL91]|uniref:ATP-binding protein n=1 Tax=Paenibacillus sp. PL91 TaxID=2729538 RepID=UPI00145C7409|nr:ATP-binding protein [Paenibacillus sp. PL91]MBC9199092.1 response regulator [Paenibacillus sp. PL91]
MGKLRHYYKKSITRRFMSMMIFTLSLILIGAFIVLLSTVSILRDYEAETTEMREKQELVSEIADHSNEIILRARGYYVYLSDFEYDQIFSEKKLLDEALGEIKTFTLSASEEEVMKNIESFFANYFDNVLPKAIDYSKAEDYDSLREFVTAGEDNPVNKLISYSYDFKNQVRLIAEAKNDSLIQRLSFQAALFIGYIILVLILSLFITRKVATDIGVPLNMLTDHARRFASGEPIELDHVSREDELGELARTFQNMMTQIQSKEEELLAQNEELIAQQDELQAQQEELQRAVGLMEKNEKYLEKRNQLVQSLSNTLDQQELLESIISNIVAITESDKGLIVMMNREHHYAAVGISDAAALQFINNIDNGVVLRAAQTKQSYSIVRDCTRAEQGYHDEPMTATDLILPVRNAGEEMVACLVITKVNREISKLEEDEIVGMMTQVSLAFDKLQLYEQSERQRLMTSDMLNTIQEGIQYLDLDGTTLQINRKMSEFFGFFNQNEESIHLPFEPFKSFIRSSIVEAEPLLQFMDALLAHGHLNGQHSMNYEIIEPERRFIQIYSEPLFRNGVKFGLLLVHRDITKEYEVDRMKSEFVSTVSHELRTPLASVLGFAELLLHRELKPERQRKYVTTIHQEARRLTTLINDFLDLQRMESGKQMYELKSFSLMPLIQEVIEMQRMASSLHEITWQNDANESLVVADRDKLQQVFINLLSNAVKYSPNGGQIIVHSDIKDGKIVIRLTDHGLGIPKDALPHLFSKFYRVDNSDRREIGGTGLGLAIVKEIVTKHKGSIEVHSEFGQGSTFIVTLPLAEQQEQLPSEEQKETSMSESSIHVMLVENDHNLSSLLRDELRSNGFQVHLFTEGSKAIEVIEQLNPDIIVIDLMLEPGITGWDIIGKIKKTDALLNKPIIISSAFEEKGKAAQWGIKEFLVKPYLPGKLSAAIMRMLR